ncbi:MAG: peptidyl-prolyl cis-trans isomerase [Rhodobacter sp. CACIA14H1]|nr:MAG: peptidyl-prolyl cis-trans isomerase [Rhodobacter sp. CACIA14H1]
MSSDRFIAAGLFALGLSALGGFALSQTATAQDATDGPGPNLVIEVAGSTTGTITIDMASDVAPNHVAQITALAQEGAYDGVVFHRVIDGFMAQTGDVEFGRQGGDLSAAGMGGSTKPDLAAEFSSVSFDRGVVGMARSMDPNSANSQFFIMFAPAPHLDGQYTVVGKVISGMEVVDAIKKGDQNNNGAVTDPDYMAKVTVQE